MSSITYNAKTDLLTSICKRTVQFFASKQRSLWFSRWEWTGSSWAAWLYTKQKRVLEIIAQLKHPVSLSKSRIQWGKSEVAPAQVFNSLRVTNRVLWGQYTGSDKSYMTHNAQYLLLATAQPSKKHRQAPGNGAVEMTAQQKRRIAI